MCEDLNVTTEIEETPPMEQPITPPEKLPMEQWWGEDREEVECVDVTPELVLGVYADLVGSARL